MKTSIASLFGLTQREMAMLLGIGYSQWSMYECGKRNLPPRAAQLPAELLTHLKSADRSKQSQKVDREIRTRKLERMLNKNQYWQLLLERKIGATKKKLTDTANYSDLLDIVARHNEIHKSGDANPLFLIRKKSSDTTEKILGRLASYELRYELLQLEKPSSTRSSKIQNNYI